MPTRLSGVSALPAKSTSAANIGLQIGLTRDEALRRLGKFGPNAMPDTTLHPLRMALEKFWASVQWMLEAAIVLQLVLGKYVEAAIIAGLLVFNAALGLFQEGRAQATLAALRSRLALNASVRRDGNWTTVPGAELRPLVCSCPRPQAGSRAVLTAAADRYQERTPWDQCRGVAGDLPRLPARRIPRRFPASFPIFPPGEISVVIRLLRGR